MKKIIFILSVLLLLTGCNAEYELNINKDNIKENLTLSAENNAENLYIEQYNSNIKSFINNEDKNEYYNITKNLNNMNYRMNIDYNFKFSDYLESNIINSSLGSFTIDPNYNRISFSTGTNFKIFDKYEYLNNLTVKINISNDFEIRDHNADSLVNNTLTWNISRADNHNKAINFTIVDITENLDDIDNNINNENNINKDVVTSDNNESNSNNFLIAISALILFVIILLIVLKIIGGINEKKRNN